MALGLAPGVAEDILDSIANGVAFTGWSTLYLQLHVGDPGAAGTSNQATETDRVAVTFAAASGGAIANDAAAEITGLAGSQDATHFTLWSASTSGTFVWSGTITANAYVAGDTIRFAVGDIDLTLGVAA